MAPLTKDRLSRYQEGDIIGFPVASGVKIFAGALVNINADGFAQPASDTYDERFVGVAIQQVSNLAGGNGAQEVLVRRNGNYLFDAVDLTVSLVGYMLYVYDDHTFSGDSYNKVLVGQLVNFISATQGVLDIHPTGNPPEPPES